MVSRSFNHRGSVGLEATLRRMIVVFRFLGWIWMTLLVIVTLVSDPPPRLEIVYGSVALATIWTVVTWYMARSHPERLSTAGWFTLDAAAMLAVGAASIASGASELFHGGLRQLVAGGNRRRPDRAAPGG